jgi:hypothetical protein
MEPEFVKTAQNLPILLSEEPTNYRQEIQQTNLTATALTPSLHSQSRVVCIAVSTR